MNNPISLNQATALTLLTGLGVMAAGLTPACAQQPAGMSKPAGLEYVLETVAIDSGERQTIYRTNDHIEAPNWSRDGSFMLFNFKGGLYRIPADGSTKPRQLDTGAAKKCNNDHGISFDGKQLAVSSRSPDKKSQIYVLPIDGGEARLVTPLSPSYWHGWSPDDQTLVYCAERDGNFDIYSVPAAGGPEKRLTTSPGLDDGPEYSPDGKYIYYNSERDGTMQIWRMKPDGSAQEPVIADDRRNWFPHLSPDGRWIAFISFGKDVMPNDHPENRDVVIRLAPAAGGEIRELVRCFGGQGTLNVPSWSPDSKKLAFVSVTKPIPPDWSLPGMPKPNYHKQVPPPADYHRPATVINQALGIFEGQADVGGPILPGNATFDARLGQYRLTSAGYNIWYTRDEFRYLWKKMVGDATLSATIEFPYKDGYFDRKAVLMFRQDLSDDSKTVMVALHGGGLIHLAQRSEKNQKITESARLKAEGRPASAKPIRLSIEKRGDTFALLASLDGEPLRQIGTTTELRLEGTFYVGIGFCSHQPTSSDTAILSDVTLK